MHYEIIKENLFLCLRLYVDDGGEWIHTNVRNNIPLRIKNTFYVNSNEISRIDDDTYQFKIGVLNNGYYKLINTLHNQNDILFSEKLDFKTKMFWCSHRISIIRAIDKISQSSIYIGGEYEDAIPIDEYMNLINKFPNSTEIQKYKEARVSTLISEYVNLKKDYQEEYETYIASKIISRNINRFEKIKEFDLLKYEYLYAKLNIMLKNIGNDGMPKESWWEEKIKEFILILFPQYINTFNQVSIKGTSSNDKKPDFILIDTNGYVDVLEIKKPDATDIFRRNKYRNNYVLSGEMSGTIMQVEKYIHCLNKNGIDKNINKNIPVDLDIKIANPRGMIIIGRSSNLSDEQKEDFEIIKRKYKHIADIITYDDLLNRLDAIIKHLKH